MSSFFEEVKNDAKEVEEKLLGPTYPYYSNIKNHFIQKFSKITQYSAFRIYKKIEP